MQQRLQQHRQHHPPVEDLRMRLNRMREQREDDELAGILPAEDSYLHNMPRHQRTAGFPPERKTTPVNRPIGKVEWDEGKTFNIKVEVSESGERLYKMDKEDALKVHSTRGRQGKLHGTNIIKNDNEPGMKTRGRGGYRGAPRGRGYFRGRGRGGYRGGRKPRADRDGTSSTTSDVTTENDGSELADGKFDEHEDDVDVVLDDHGNEYHVEDEYPEGDAQCDPQHVMDEASASGTKTSEASGSEETKASSSAIKSPSKNAETPIADKPEAVALLQESKEIEELSTALEAKVTVQENGGNVEETPDKVLLDDAKTKPTEEETKLVEEKDATTK